MKIPSLSYYGTNLKIAACLSHQKKSQAITVTTSIVDNPEQPIFALSKGQSQDFPIPEFAKHEDEAWSVGHLNVQIGSIIKTGYPIVDSFNQLIMDIFNAGSGNMLQKENVLSWNVWFTPPGIVDQDEWARHAWVWRESLDADHGSPEGEGTAAKYYDGTLFKPDLKAIKEQEKSKLLDFLEKIEKQEKGKVLNFLEKIEDKEKDKITSFLKNL